MNTKKFGTLLMQKRTTLMLSQSKVAELCYLSRSTYNHYEHGLRLPTLETLFRLSEVLKTDVNEFILAIISEDVDYNEDKENVLNNPPDLLQESSPSNSEYQNNFIDSFNLLDYHEQKAIVDIMDSIISSNNNDAK